MTHDQKKSFVLACRPVTGFVIALVLIPVLTALMLPVVQSAREAARRRAVLGKLKALNRALSDDESAQLGSSNGSKMEAPADATRPANVLGK